MFSLLKLSSELITINRDISSVRLRLERNRRIRAEKARNEAEAARDAAFSQVDAKDEQLDAAIRRIRELEATTRNFRRAIASKK